MSVIKSQRSTSPVEFINTARQLEIYTIQKAVGFPKRYTFYVSQPLANTATHIHKMVKMGNSIYPQNQHEVQIRRDYFLKALAELQALVSQIEVAAQLFPIDGNQMKFWMDMVNKEDRHIKSVTMDERVVQRCLCDNALVPVLQPTFIYDNGASTKDKGYHFAIRRCEKHLHDHYRKYGQNGYVLTFDFSKFFDRVSHALVEEIVRKNFSDTRLIGLIMDLINAFGNEGLGLGSQVSQVFALASANRLDHYCKEVLRIHGYGRYMDDGYLISESKDYLKTCLGHIQRVCNELHITLNLKKTKIIKLSKGFTFLKCRFYLTKTGKVVKKIYKTSVTKMRRKLKKFLLMMQSGVLTMQDVYQAFQSWRAYARHFDAWHTIKSMERLFDDLFVPGLVRG